MEAAGMKEREEQGDGVNRALREDSFILFHVEGWAGAAPLAASGGQCPVTGVTRRKMRCSGVGGAGRRAAGGQFGLL